MQHRQKRGGKCLTFVLAKEEYGIEILKVQEIIGMMSVTPIPRTPPCVRGVINLRGKVIPIVDLRLKFGMLALAQTEETCIIVVRVQGREMGLVVDKVSEVLDIAPEDIDDVPSFGAEVHTEYILGIGKAAGKVTLLLAIDRVLSPHEIVALHSASGVAEQDTEVPAMEPALMPG